VFSFFPEYIINDSVFSGRYLVLYICSLLFAIFTIIYQILYKCRKIYVIEIDILYSGIFVLYLFSILKTDYRSSLFLMQYIAQFIIYFCIRLNYDTLRKYFRTEWYAVLAGLLIITHSIIAIIMHVKNGYGLAGVFKNSNYYACYIAVLFLPLFAVLLYTKPKGKLWWWTCTVAIIALLNIVYTCSRTAILGIVIAGGLLLASKPSIRKKIRSYYNMKRLVLTVLVLIPVMSILVWGAYCVKPVSVGGRILAWKITLNTIRTHLFSGIGPGQVANMYNHFQAQYFSAGLGSIPERMAASESRQIFNWYLEIIAEYGLIGAIPFVLFWYYSIKKAVQTFVEKKLTCNSETVIVKGCAAIVIGFLTMSLTHFPQKIIPTFLLFNCALAFVVSYRSEKKQKPGRL